MTHKLLAAAILLVAAPTALAEPAGFLDLFYVPSAEIDQSGVPETIDGDGFGVRGMAPVSEELLLAGEYQATSYEGGIDAEQARAGLCLAGAEGGGLLVEYISTDLDGSKADGFGVHLRIGGPMFYGQAGYVSLQDEFEDHDGLEITVGVLLRGRERRSGLFVELRRTSLEGKESSTRTTLDDIRAGLRIAF